MIKYFVKLKSDLSELLFSTYYGGAGDDYDPVGERGIKFYNCRIYTIVTSKSNNIPLHKVHSIRRELVRLPMNRV
ncbi:MAG: hypothetical protein IPG90_22170 [Bacteroidetes bacterium]|nr:hypothetical protein [Bacteroidota bacterium]